MAQLTRRGPSQPAGIPRRQGRWRIGKQHAPRCIEMLKSGDKIFAAHRRLFEKDEARFFIGEVDGAEAGVIKATGHSYVRDPMAGSVIEKADKRTKILALASGTLLVYQLPDNLSLDALKFVSIERHLFLTDGGQFKMNLSEHVQDGQV
jgi:hypothetical protein